MENEEIRVKILTDSDRNYLRSKTPFILPDNPSDKRFSASQIKRAMYEGYLILFDWIKELQGDVNTANGNIFQEIQYINNYLGNPISVEETEYVIPLEDR